MHQSLHSWLIKIFSKSDTLPITLIRQDYIILKNYMFSKALQDALSLSQRYIHLEQCASTSYFTNPVEEDNPLPTAKTLGADALMYVHMSNAQRTTLIMRFSIFCCCHTLLYN